MSTHTFIVNGKQVTRRLPGRPAPAVGAAGHPRHPRPEVRLRPRRVQGCTCHINGKAFNPCSVPVSDIQPTDEITTIEGLAATVGKDLHPMQQAWLEFDVAQCGYCQPGQIMAAVAMVKQIQAQGGGEITDAELDEIRNVCRCGTYFRIREAIRAGAANM